MPSDDNLIEIETSILEGILSFDCVVGEKNCIYQNKKSLAQGKMNTAAKTKLITNLN